MPDLLTRSIDVVEGASCSPTNGDNWWDNPFSTPTTTTTASPEYHNLPIPSSYHFSNSTIPQSTTSQSAIYTSAYPWPQPERFTPYTPACSGVEVNSQSYALTMSGRGFHMSPQAIYSSPPPYPYSNFSSGVSTGTVQNGFYSSGDTSPMESPVSSPESLDFFTPEKPKLTTLPRVDQLCMPPPPLTTELPKYSLTNTFGNYTSSTQAMQMDSRMTKKQVRMPQRKLF